MTKTTEKTEATLGRTVRRGARIGRASRKQAIDAIRKFVDQVGGEVPDEARRKNVIDAALDLTEELVTGRIDFLRSVCEAPARR